VSSRVSAAVRSHSLQSSSSYELAEKTLRGHTSTATPKAQTTKSPAELMLNQEFIAKYKHLLQDDLKDAKGFQNRKCKSGQTIQSLDVNSDLAQFYNHSLPIVQVGLNLVDYSQFLRLFLSLMIHLSSSCLNSSQ
jgi:hypothetical protein